MQTKAKVNFKFTKFVILLFYVGFQTLPPPPGPAWVRSRRESQIKLSTHYTVSISQQRTGECFDYNDSYLEISSNGRGESGVYRPMRMFDRSCLSFTWSRSWAYHWMPGDLRTWQLQAAPASSRLLRPAADVWYWLYCLPASRWPTNKYQNFPQSKLSVCSSLEIGSPLEVSGHTRKNKTYFFLHLLLCNPDDWCWTQDRGGEETVMLYLLEDCLQFLAHCLPTSLGETVVVERCCVHCDAAYNPA